MSVHVIKKDIVELIEIPKTFEFTYGSNWGIRNEVVCIGKIGVLHRDFDKEYFEVDHELIVHLKKDIDITNMIMTVKKDTCSITMIEKVNEN